MFGFAHSEPLITLSTCLKSQVGRLSYPYSFYMVKKFLFENCTANEQHIMKSTPLNGIISSLETRVCASVCE